MSDPRLPTIDFALPGTWWHVPLDSPEAITASARKLARDTVGSADDLAPLRHALAAEVARAAEAARRICAQDFYFARELVPGRRIPLALTISWPEVPWLPSRSAAVFATQSMAESLHRTNDPGEVEVVRETGVGVVRQVRQSAAHSGDHTPEGSTEAVVPNLSVTYWILNPNSDRTLVMSFSCPLVELSDAVVALSDGIVETITFRTVG